MKAEAAWSGSSGGEIAPIVQVQMIFKRPHEGVLKVDSSCLELLLERQQHTVTAPESGGILLGRLIEGGSDVIIDEATMPTGADKASRFFFWRSRDPAQKHVDAAWRASLGTRVYLGEWHTHPEDNPAPSQHDFENWAEILRKTKCEQDALFFLIIGLKGIVAWEGDITTRQCHELDAAD